MLIILIVLVVLIISFKKEVINYFNNKPIENITFVSNNEFTNKNIIDQAIVQSNNKNKSYTDFNTQDLATVLKKYNWIKHASVKKVWPNRLIVKITELKPFAYWTNGLQEGYLTSQGQLFYSPEQQAKNLVFRHKYLNSESTLVITNNKQQTTNPNIVLDTSKDFPLIISNQKYIKIGFEFWNKLTPLFNSYNLKVKQLRINSVNSWEILLSNGLVLKLDDFNIEKTLQRFLLSSKQIPIPAEYNISYIDLRYNNGFAIRFVDKDDLAKNPNLLIRSLAPGYGGQKIPNATFAPDYGL